MKKVIAILAVIGALLACRESRKSGQATEAVQGVEEGNGAWISLVEATDWRGYNHDSLPDNWNIRDGIIECFGKAGDVGGDIVSTGQYENFELRLEWKISKGGNSGIFYHVIEDTIYHSPYQTGPEYQILDDEGYEGSLEESQKAGADYAMHVANDKKKLKPVGAWNTARIVFNRGKVEHWLNGEKIVEFDKNSSDWKEKRNSGKWEEYPDYGTANRGYLGLQDHGAGVWFRKVEVRRL
ncbi:MAG TPA: DUF1080 domain-containing protein [Eudoraea sp.]|nr:DUF1080 domain-containing protein [Eudoraea sp.]